MFLVEFLVQESKWYLFWEAFKRATFGVCGRRCVRVLLGWDPKKRPFYTDENVIGVRIMDIHFYKNIDTKIMIESFMLRRTMFSCALALFILVPLAVWRNGPLPRRIGQFSRWVAPHFLLTDENVCMQTLLKVKFLLAVHILIVKLVGWAWFFLMDHYVVQRWIGQFGHAYHLWPSYKARYDES